MHQQRQRCGIGHRLGNLKHVRRAHQRALGVAAGAVGEAAHLSAVGRTPRAPAARDHRQRLAGQVRVLDRVGVGVIDPGGLDVEEHLTLIGLRVSNLGPRQHLGTAEFGDLNRMHGAEPVADEPPQRECDHAGCTSHQRRTRTKSKPSSPTPHTIMARAS